MAPREFHRLEVADVRKETDAATSVAFAVPDALADAYRFIPGQYLTLRANVNGEELRRPYSVCVSPASGELRVCVKKLEGGRFSGFVNEQLRIGDAVDVLPPMGRFHAPIEKDAARHYVGIAGGSGITPVISILRTVLATSPASSFTLLYGNRAVSDIIFREALADLKDRYLGRLRLLHVLSDELPDSELLGGLLTADKVREIAEKLLDVAATDWFFICGPGPMMDGATEALLDLGVAPEKIKIESFGNRPVAPAVAAAKDEVAHAAGPAADVEVVYRGRRKQIRVPYAGAAILDMAHAARIDVPFACKGGVCCTCRAKLLEGEVDMDIVYGLEPDEIAAGYILTCQAHPKSEKLVVDYDL